MKPTKKHYRVEVGWEDSSMLTQSWHNISTALTRRDVVECTSVGFVLADDDKGLVLAGSIHGNEAAGVVIIPRGQITKVRRLR